MADLKAPQRNKILGLLADSISGFNEFASKDNPPVNAILGLLGTPAVANTLNELSYGNYGALGTGSGMTWKPKADTVDAAMLLAPMAMSAGKAAIDGGVSLARRAEPAIAAAVDRTMAQGGKPAQLLSDLAYGTKSPATVWHGSPHKFDKFDASKIGTGEGAQAYGHGLYVAENPSVAKGYAEKLTNAQNLTGASGNIYKTRFDGKSQAMDEAVHILNSGIYKNVDDAIHETQEIISSFKPGDQRITTLSNRLEAYKEMARDLVRVPEQQFYKIDLPDEHIAKMLDWDKPLSQQPQAVRDLLGVSGKAESMTGQQFLKNVELNPSQYFDNTFTGKELTQAHIYPERGASDYLKAKGIPGIRYLDGGSRGAGAGTSNYVIFPGNENMLNILERNGQPLGLLGNR